MLLEMALTKVVIVEVAGGFSKLQLSRSFHQPHSNARDTERIKEAIKIIEYLLRLNKYKQILPVSKWLPELCDEPCVSGAAVVELSEQTLNQEYPEK